MDASSDSQRHPSGEDAAVGVQLQQMSACLDGELSDAEFSDVLQCLDRQSGGSMRQSWTAYHLIGESLRGEIAGHRGLAPADFLAGVRGRLAEDAQAEVVPPSLPLPDVSQPLVRGKAANDAVFRWKMVAGLASVAAVMAVTWGVLGTGPSGVSGPVMAQRGGEGGRVHRWASSNAWAWARLVWAASYRVWQQIFVCEYLRCASQLRQKIREQR